MIRVGLRHCEDDSVSVPRILQNSRFNSGPSLHLENVSNAWSVNGSTDANGEARFRLPEPAPEHLAANVSVTSEHWHCGCGVLAVMQDVIQKGVVGPLPRVDSRKFAFPVEPVPGKILFVARPLSFFERLLYPLTKY
jgi:hypothetical protein